MEVRKIFAICVVLLSLTACLDPTPVEVTWSRIQDTPVPAWLESWVFAKIENIDSNGCEELSRVIVEQNNINTAQEAVFWLRKNFEYIRESGDVWFDIKRFVERGGGDCEDWAIAVARLWQALGLESYVVIHFNANTIYAHAFAVHVEQDHLRCATPYVYVQQQFVKLQDAVQYVNAIYQYELGPYIAIPIEMVGSGAGGSRIGAR